MNKLSNKHFIFFAFIFTVFLGSCKSTTSPNGGTTVTIPGVGSFFVLNNEGRDSTNTVISSDTEKDTFVSTGLTVLGKTNVAGMISSTGSKDTNYFNYESNGDLSVLTDDGGTLAWWTYPFGSQGTVHLPVVSNPGYYATTTATGAGQGTSTIKGQSVTTEKVLVTRVITDTIGGQVTTETASETIQFAPSLGWIVEANMPGTRDASNGAMGDSYHVTLIDYKLQ